MNMSFMLTTRQMRARTKTVTKRLRWLNLKAGDVLWAVEKSQGRKPGEAIVRIGRIEVVSVRREPLSACTNDEAAREGFPEMTGRDFVTMFCGAMKCDRDEMITRIEFKHLEG